MIKDFEQDARIMYLCAMKMKKIISWVIAIIIICALSLWIKSRWTAWFSSPDEAEFSCAQAPDRITMTPGEDFVSERVISWRCGAIKRHSYLTLATSRDTAIINADEDLVVSRGGNDIFYHAELENLIPDSTYSYKVTTGEQSSKWFSFKIPSRSGNRKIIYVGDVQDTIGGNSGIMFDKLYREHSDATFWAFGGDLIEAPLDKYWNYLYKSNNETFAKVPVVCATGNHEYLKTIYRTLDPRWTKTFSYPDNGAEFFEGRSYYIEDDNVLMVVLDTNGVQDALTIMSEHNWLKEVLQEEGIGKWKIVMFHHPLFSVRPKKNNFMLRNAIDPLLQKYGVHLVLQGHEHGYGSYVAEPAVRNYPLYIVSHASPKGYTTAESKKNMKIVPHKRMYQIIETSNGSLTYKALDVETDSIIDNITIKR